MKKLVIIPGGFHPFHAGHKNLYDAARQKFPQADVYIAATADTSTRPFPFKLKKQLAGLAGVPAHRFIQVKSPFAPREITQHYDPDETVLIYARSEKDRDQSPVPGGTKKSGEPSYLQPLPGKDRQPMSVHGYMTYLPTVQFGGMTSATEIRSKWPEMEPEAKQRLVNLLYPRTAGNTKFTDVVVNIYDQVLGSQPVNEQAETQPQTLLEIVRAHLENAVSEYKSGNPLPLELFIEDTEKLQQISSKLQELVAHDTALSANDSSVADYIEESAK